MLLTLKQPSNHHGFKSFHDYAPPTPPSTFSRYTPALSSAGPTYSPPPPSALRKSSADQPMSTPHRGLPPPAAMTLPQPASVSQQSSRDSQSLVPSGGQLPAPPQQWRGEEDSMRNWLSAKAEEDRRRQEEEKTRQETLRLEQRRIEQDMLKTSLAGGIPPYLIPMVFAGMGGGNLPTASLEWAQQFMSQAQQLQVQQLQMLPQSATRPPSPSIRREDGQISHSYASSQYPMPAPLPSQPNAVSGSSGSVFVPGYSMSSPGSRPRPLPGPSALARPPRTSQLPRLDTLNAGEMHINPPAQGLPTQTLPGQPLESQRSQENETDASPQLYFHHWQPPTTQGSGSTAQPSPNDQSSNSPRKRKAQGPQQAAPPPTSQPRYHSPPFSHTGSSTSGPSGTPNRRNRGHSRSERGSLDYARGRNRHHPHESEGNSQIGISPDQQRYTNPNQDGPISGRRNTTHMPRDDRTDPRQQPIHLQHHQQHPHPHQYQSQPQPSPHQHHQQQPHYNDNRNIYSSGPDLRREVGRGGERSPDR